MNKYSKNNSKGRTKKNNYMDRTNHKYEGQPIGDDSIRDHISFRALRDLPHSSYSVKVDPYTASLPTSNPYPLLNRFNRLVDCKYDGEDNIDGGNVQQYGNSVTSKFLKCFDSIRLKFKINYRYLPIIKNEQQIGYNLVDEMRRSVAETVSILQSSTYHNMAINNFAVATDMNMGTANSLFDEDDPTTYVEETVDDETVKIPLYKNQTDVIYSMAIFYQIFLQEALSVMNTHNAFRLKQGTMIRNAWNREVPTLNGFFGLMNKKAFLSMLESINLSFEGEYVDTSWMKDVNSITTIPSRRSNSMFDPVKEIQVDYNWPTYFKVYIMDENGDVSDDTKIFDLDQLMYNYVDSDGAQTASYTTLCSKLKSLLSMESTVNWARKVYSTPSASLSENNRYNNIKTLFDGINLCFTIFKPLWSDFREIMDTMQRTGAVSWTKGFRPGITNDTDADMYDNKIVDDIYNLIFSGPVSISFDDNTKRFKSWSYWNMYKGIASYDVKSGGSFLTFSFKQFEGDDSDDVFKYVPQLFTVDTANPYAAIVSRDGIEVLIDFDEWVLDNHIETSRLVPLMSQSDISSRMPKVVELEGNELSEAHKSILLKFLTQEFGMGKVDIYTMVDPDIFAVYQIELNDISNEAITYARANAPYRGTTSRVSILGMLPSLHK